MVPVLFLFLLVPGIGSGMLLWHSLDLPFNCFISYSKTRALFLNRDDTFTSKRVIMRPEQPSKCFVPLQKQTEGEVGRVKLVLAPSYSSLTVRR